MQQRQGFQFMDTFVNALESAEREASEWIARLNADDVSPDDGARFEVWRQLNPQNARAYEELAATWRDLTLPQPDR